MSIPSSGDINVSPNPLDFDGGIRFQPAKLESKQSPHDLTMMAAEWQTEFDPHPIDGENTNWNADAGIGVFSAPSLDLPSPSAWPQDDEEAQAININIAMATDPLANGMDWRQSQENNPSALSPNSTIAFPTPPLVFDSDPIPTPIALPAVTLATVVATQLSNFPNAAQTTGTAALHKPVKPLACIRCRHRKISCDTVRPCSRCVHAGEACVDRTEDDIRAAKKRQGKRKPAEENEDATTTAQRTTCGGPTSTVLATFPVATIPPSMPPASYPVDSFEAYSALTLQAAFRLHHMPLLWWLYEHVQVNSKTAELARVFQWKTCLETYLAGMCDVLTVADSGKLLNATLPGEVMQSPEWMRSPFAKYVQPATRRLYHEVSAQQSPVCCFNGDLRFYNPSAAAPNTPQLQPDANVNVPAQLLVEWLPEAQTAWSQLESLDASQALFDRSALKRQRIGCGGSGGDSALQSNSLTPNDTIMPFLDTIATQLAHKLVHGDDGRTTLPTAVASPTSSSSASPSNPPSSSSSAASSASSDHDTLNSHFGRLMSITDGHQPDAEMMALNASMPRVYQHATWCPRHHAWSSHTSSIKHEANATSQISASAVSSLTTTSAFICLCSLSTPFPCRVVVNSTFERVTGWSQQEIVSQWSSEYLAAIRVLLHPSGWPSFVDDLQQQRMYAFNLLREAIRSAEGEPVDVSTLKSVAQRNPRKGAVEVRPFFSNSFLRNKWSGQPVACLMTKFMGHEVGVSDEDLDQDQHSTPSSDSGSAASSMTQVTNTSSTPPQAPRPRRFFGFIVQLEIKSA